MSSLLPWLGPALLLAGLATACQNSPDQPAPLRTGSRLYSAMLRRLLAQSVPGVSVADLPAAPAAVLLDARPAHEFAVSHLPGARWVGYDEFDLTAVQDLPRDTPIVVYCSVGLRSERIGLKLQQAGYGQVRNLFGGIFEWVNAGRPVVDSMQQPTQRVHAYSPAWGIWLRKGQKVY